MSETATKAERRAKWEAWKADPDAMEELESFIAEGRGGLATFAAIEGFAVVTLYDWVKADPIRSERYARAREIGADALAEAAAVISRDRARDPQCRRVEIDHNKWLAGKIRPKVYGDRIQQDVTGTLTIEDALKQLPPA